MRPALLGRNDRRDGTGPLAGRIGGCTGRCLDQRVNICHNGAATVRNGFRLNVNLPDFDAAFKALTTHRPFPWQRRLFDLLRSGDLPPAVDIPTGLGKTAVMAVWLLSRAAGAPLPRRLVYVVDRHAVVDQATDFAEQLRERLQLEALGDVRRGLGLGSRRLPISTLRGQHVDNREWLDDPAAPAIVVGTVDMIGSRLLFEGYGVSRRMRPYQAGLMGCDTLVLLDETHLSRPFGRLLQAIEKEQQPAVSGGAHSSGRLAGPLAGAGVPPPFRVVPLSATLGTALASSVPFGLCEEDRSNETVRARLDASKTLTVEDVGADVPLETVLAERACNLARRTPRESPVRMLICCNSRSVAESVAENIRERVGTEAAVLLFVGDRRVHEREAAARELCRHGWLADGSQPDAPVFLVATSAAEVGVDLDADHMVCDLVTWERMVQRLGRVNLRGLGDARILVVDPGPTTKTPEEDVARLRATKALLKSLPAKGRGGRQAGPAALADVGKSPEAIASTIEASARMPLYPELTRPLVDAWAMTSLLEHSGRPEVGPWLRGWVAQEPQTMVVWRRCLPVQVVEETATAPLADTAVEEFFEAAYPHAAERLETETRRVVAWLVVCARRLLDAPPLECEDDAEEDGAASSNAGTETAAPARRADPLAFVLDSAGKPESELRRGNYVLTLGDAATLRTQYLEQRLAGRTLVVHARICGLREGLLDADAPTRRVATAEDNWGNPDAWDTAADDAAVGLPGVQVRLLSDDARTRLTAARAAPGEGEPGDAWRELWAAPYRVSAADQPESWLVVEKWRGATSGEDSRAVAPTHQRLQEHQEWAAREAGRIADELRLPAADRAMLVAAARHHDDGKRVARWQQAFNARHEAGPYAKTPGPVNRHVLNGYCHEFQSAIDAEERGLDDLDRSDPRFELALHLIAAHHGRARPAIGIEGCDALPPSAAAERAAVVGRRFLRLQRQWGPWGLAWWEALLRAANQRASRALDDQARRAAKTGTTD